MSIVCIIRRDARALGAAAAACGCALAMPSRSREPRRQSSDANSRNILYGSSLARCGTRPYNQLARALAT